MTLHCRVLCDATQGRLSLGISNITPKFVVLGFSLLVDCVIPENVHTPLDCEQSLFFLLSSSSRGKTLRTPARGHLYCYSLGFRDVFPRLDELKRKNRDCSRSQSNTPLECFFFYDPRIPWNFRSRGLGVFWYPSSRPSWNFHFLER